MEQALSLEELSGNTGRGGKWHFQALEDRPQLSPGASVSVGHMVYAEAALALLSGFGGSPPPHTRLTAGQSAGVWASGEPCTRGCPLEQPVEKPSHVGTGPHSSPGQTLRSRPDAGPVPRPEPGGERTPLLTPSLRPRLESEEAG